MGQGRAGGRGTGAPRTNEQYAACKTFVKCKLAKMCGGWKGSAASAVFSPCQWHRMVGGEGDVRIRGGTGCGLLRGRR